MGKRIELKAGQKLFTQKGIETKFSFVKDIEIRKYGKTFRRIIEVICECGRTKEVQLNNVIGGHSICCGFSPCKTPFNKDKRSIETTYNSIFYAYKSGAVKRNLIFELTKDQFKEFLKKNCYYCNQPPSSLYQIKNSKTGEIRAGLPLLYNGIDRINNDLGYTVENSVTCCETCNKMKHAYDYTFFINHINKIYNHLFKNYF